MLVFKIWAVKVQKSNERDSVPKMWPLPIYQLLSTFGHIVDKMKIPLSEIWHNANPPRLIFPIKVPIAIYQPQLLESTESIILETIQKHPYNNC